MSEPTEQVAASVCEFLQKSGIDTSKLNSDELKIELTKTITLSRVSKLMLQKVMPYPVESPDHYFDFFSNDKKIVAIQDFLQWLLSRQGSNETLFYKMALETPATIMNNKEIIMQLERLAKEDRQLANVFIHLHNHYNPSEAYRYRFIYGVSLQLEQCIVHYNRLCSEYKSEARFHKAKAVAIHEEDAEKEYVELRSRLHELENKVNMLAEITNTMGTEQPYSVPKRLYETASATSSEKKKEASP